MIGKVFNGLIFLMGFDLRQLDKNKFCYLSLLTLVKQGDLNHSKLLVRVQSIHQLPALVLSQIKKLQVQLYEETCFECICTHVFNGI